MRAVIIRIGSLREDKDVTQSSRCGCRCVTARDQDSGISTGVPDSDLSINKHALVCPA